LAAAVGTGANFGDRRRLIPVLQVGPSVESAKRSNPKSRAIRRVSRSRFLFESGLLFCGAVSRG